MKNRNRIQREKGSQAFLEVQERPDQQLVKRHNLQQTRNGPTTQTKLETIKIRHPRTVADAAALFNARVSIETA
jgi:hypothetical protein